MCDFAQLKQISELLTLNSVSWINFAVQTNKQLEFNGSICKVISLSDKYKLHHSFLILVRNFLLSIHSCLQSSLRQLVFILCDISTATLYYKPPSTLLRLSAFFYICLMFACSLTRLSMKKGLLGTFVRGQVIFKMTLMSTIPHGESESISK